MAEDLESGKLSSFLQSLLDFAPVKSVTNAVKNSVFLTKAIEKIRIEVENYAIIVEVIQTSGIIGLLFLLLRFFLPKTALFLVEDPDNNICRISFAAIAAATLLFMVTPAGSNENKKDSTP
jgi:hypothetical protein